MIKKLLVLAAVVAFGSAAHAATANSMILCVSDNNFTCNGTGNGVTMVWNSGVLTTNTFGNGHIVADPTTNSSLTLDATFGNFTLSITTGAYQPSAGTAMDLNSINIASAGPGGLYLVFGAGNYTGNVPYAEVGSVTLNPGVTSATDTACFEEAVPSYFICGSSGSAPNFGSATTTSTGTLSFAGVGLPGSGTYGLEEDALVNFAAAGTFSGDLSLEPTPEPGSLMLLGSGFLGLAGLLRRKISLTN